MAHSFEQPSDQVAGKYGKSVADFSIKKRGDIPDESRQNPGSVFSLMQNDRPGKNEETKNVSITYAYEFNISHLMELGDEESIRYVLQLIINLIPQYIGDLRDAVSRENKEDFLAKSHKLRGSISTIQVPAILMLIGAADGIAKAANWKSLRPILDKMMAIYLSLYPKISEEVEKQIEQINNDKLIAA